MGPQLSKYFKGTHTHAGTPADFTFKNCGPSSYAFVTKHIDLTKHNSEHQQPLWGTFEMLKHFLKLDNHSSKISKIEWNIYFDWYFEVSKCYQEPKIASLQSKI